MQRLSIDVWSDVACPWCYVGKRRLELALARFPHRDQVDVVWRSFELDPAAPKIVDASVTAVPYAARLARKYGTAITEAERRIADMAAVAARDGLEVHFERVRPGNTFDAHRLLHRAGERGVQNEVKERFFRGYFTDGVAIGESSELAALAVAAGLPPDDVAEVLATDAHAEDVREDERAAQAIGVRGVPFFAIDGRYGLSGAQPPEVLLEAIGRAHRELSGRGDPPGPSSPSSDGPIV
jgi:predicted DsbA family dithiol-disulfide isomerase